MERYSGHDPARGCGLMLVILLILALVLLGFVVAGLANLTAGAR